MKSSTSSTSTLVALPDSQNLWSPHLEITVRALFTSGTKMLHPYRRHTISVVSKPKELEFLKTILPPTDKVCQDWFYQALE